MLTCLHYGYTTTDTPSVQYAHAHQVISYRDSLLTLTLIHSDYCDVATVSHAVSQSIQHHDAPSTDRTSGDMDVYPRHTGLHYEMCVRKLRLIALHN